MAQYIIVNPRTGKPVQNWSFAQPKHIIYCVSPVWAMKFDDEESANKRIAYLKENFPGQDLTALPVTIETTWRIG